MYYADYNKAVKTAMEVLEDFDISQAPIDLEIFFKGMAREVKKFSYRDFQEKNNKTESETLAFMNSDRGAVTICDIKSATYLIYYDDTLSEGWIRFNLAHELGHIFLEHCISNDVERMTSIPRDLYDEFEKEVLLMQFHDVLPGTSIERVYREAEERHACWMERIGEWYGTRKEACFFNPTSAPLTRFQKAAEGWRILQLPPFAWGGSRPWNGSLVRGQGNTLDNGVIRVGFDTQGGVAGWFDYRTGRELLTAPALFQLYADKGNAWNIEPGTYDAPLEPGLQLVSQRIYADGPVGCCRQEYRYGNSRMRAEFRLNADASACEVFVTLEWRDPEHLMRFELPGAVDADTAQYAAQYGFEEFSTRSAGSVERAQYEIAAQRWVRIADETAALSLVSDCKYGFSVKNGRLNITLLRCAERPGSFIGKDDKARSGNARYNDLGHHEFAFAFAVDHGDATLPMELAEWLNRPVAAAPETASDAGCKLDWTGGQFAVTMMRPAWQGGGVLLRVYERFGKSGVLPELPGVRLTAVRPDGRALGGISATEFHPFEIKTFRVQFSNNRSSMNQ